MRIFASSARFRSCRRCYASAWAFSRSPRSCPNSSCARTEVVANRSRLRRSRSRELNGAGVLPDNLSRRPKAKTKAIAMIRAERLSASISRSSRAWAPRFVGRVEGVSVEYDSAAGRLRILPKFMRVAVAARFSASRKTSVRYSNRTIGVMATVTQIAECQDVKTFDKRPPVSFRSGLNS